MTHECIFSRLGYFGRSEWFLDERALLISPQGSPTEVYPIREIAGISGDGYTIQLVYRGDTLTLSRLGADGPPLVEALRRTWPLLRAGALGLAGSGKPRRFEPDVTGTPTSMPEESVAAVPAAPVACEALLYEDVLLIARDGRDLEPLFLTDFSDITFDDSRYTVRCREWTGAVTVFSRLAGQTVEFAHELKTRRDALAREADETVARWLPSLSLPARAALAARWLPGQMVSLEQLEAIAPGVTTALTATWIARLPRHREAAALAEWADAGELHIGFTRPDAATARSGAAGADAGAADAALPDAAADGPELWLLAARGDRWLLENVSAHEHATYEFQGDSQMTRLVDGLVCAPQFSREALYLPQEQLAGEHSDLAIPARDLSFLRHLRERFQGRLIYTTPQEWQAGLDG